jgi:hypothetical protein
MVSGTGAPSAPRNSGGQTMSPMRSVAAKSAPRA